MFAELVFLLSLLLIVRNVPPGPPTDLQEMQQAEEHVELPQRNAISRIQIMGDATDKQSSFSNNCKRKERR